MIAISTEIREVKTVEELFALMPFFMEGYDAMNRKQKVFDVDREGYVKTLLGIINTNDENGILVAYVGGQAVGYGAAYNDSPTYSQEKHLLLWSLYVRPEFSKKIRVEIFQAAEELAKKRGYSQIHAFNSRFSGASFRLFEKILGMRRSRIQFTKNI